MKNFKEIYDQSLVEIGEYRAAVEELARQEDEKAAAAEGQNGAEAAQIHKATAAGIRIALEYADDMLAKE